LKSDHLPAPRYPASLKVSFSGGLLSAETTNISTTGMFVRTSTELPIGAVVPVALELPDADPPVPVQAKVIHVRSPSLSRVTRLDPGLGVEFVDADDAFRARGGRYI